MIRLNKISRCESSFLLVPGNRKLFVMDLLVQLNQETLILLNVNSLRYEINENLRHDREYD